MPLLFLSAATGDNFANGRIIKLWFKFIFATAKEWLRSMEDKMNQDMSL
jgi:hypothetical protein